MSDLLDRIAYYFAHEYSGDDENTKEFKVSVDDLRYIANLNREKCALERKLKECSQNTKDK